MSEIKPYTAICEQFDLDFKRLEEEVEDVKFFTDRAKAFDVSKVDNAKLELEVAKRYLERAKALSTKLLECIEPVPIEKNQSTVAICKEYVEAVEECADRVIELRRELYLYQFQNFLSCGRMKCLYDSLVAYINSIININIRKYEITEDMGLLGLNKVAQDVKFDASKLFVDCIDGKNPQILCVVS